MKLSDRLISEAEDLWIEAAGKEFLADMAEGTLEERLYKNYMIQDYLYLKDYIEILKRILELADDDELRVFLAGIIKDTEYETYKVHVPSLRSLGITDDDVEACEKDKVIAEYIGFMMSQLNENGILAGLTALLQCSWNYAYVAKAVSDRYSDKLLKSKYKGWFDAYTAKEYIDSNRSWIDMLDERTGSISIEKADLLCEIFKICAEFENKLWDSLSK